MAEKAKEKDQEKAKPKKVKSGKAKNSLILIFGAITGAVFLPTSVLLFVGMLPTVVVALADRSRRKTKVITVGAMNLAGCSPFLLELWSQGHRFEKTFSILADPLAVIIMYSAACIGYLINWALAGMIANVLFQRALARQKAILDRQEELVERWGREVTGTIPMDQYGFPLEHPGLSDKKP